ncbi:hypothetical protein [Streptosporangium sp. NPDC049644]|uniref:hypothetical protein n=1 Tax=Streptosporangium sp. NPDC049644 TaxID=3155507 RepID=UPI00341BA49D
MSGDDDLWPVLPSEMVADALADPAVSAEVFSTVAALTVAICENPWLRGSNELGADPDWREILIAPDTASPNTGSTETIAK